jgi:hypothetical protein
MRCFPKGCLPNMTRFELFSCFFPFKLIFFFYFFSSLSVCFKTYIAAACEKAGLYNRALEHYTDLSDILRCISNTTKIAPDFLLTYVKEGYIYIYVFLIVVGL